MTRLFTCCLFLFLFVACGKQDPLSGRTPLEDQTASVTETLSGMAIFKHEIIPVTDPITGTELTFKGINYRLFHGNGTTEWHVRIVAGQEEQLARVRSRGLTDVIRQEARWEIQHDEIFFTELVTQYWTGQTWEERTQGLSHGPIRISGRWVHLGDSKTDWELVNQEQLAALLLGQAP